MASPQHQNSQQSAIPWPPSNPSTSSLQHANLPDFSLRLQIQRLRHDLAHAQKQIQEYKNSFSSLNNNICVKCRTHFEKHAPAGLTTSSTAGAVIVSPSSKAKLSLPLASNSTRSPSNRNRMFKGHHTAPNRPANSVRSGASHVKASNSSQHNRSVSASSESIQPSPSVTQQPISLPETNTSPKDQRDWSVNFNSVVKPELNLKVEHVLSHREIVGCVKFSPDGKYLAVGVNDGRRTYIYDLKTGVKSCLADNSETRELGIWSLCFSPDGKYIAVGSGWQLRIWEIAKKRTHNIFRGHEHLIRDLDFSPDGRFLVSCSYDWTVRIWRMRDGFLQLLEDRSATFFYSVKFNPDGRYIAAGNLDEMVRIWSVQTGQLVEKWGHGDTVHSVAFTPDGKGLVSGSSDTWKYWDISFLESTKPGYAKTKDSTAEQKSKVTVHTNSVSSIAISPDGPSGPTDDTVRIWALRNAALKCTLKGHRAHVCSVEICPTGNYLASSSNDGQVVLWRYEAA